MSKYGNIHTEGITASGLKVAFKSKLEWRWSQYLDFLLRADEIKSWDYELEVAEFEEHRHGVTRYLPDFKVVELDDSVTWHECKGFLDGKSRTKIKRFREHIGDRDQFWLVVASVPAGTTSKSRMKLTALNKMERWCDRIVDAGKIFRQVGIE